MQTKQNKKTTTKNADLGKKSLDSRTSHTNSSDKPQPAQRFQVRCKFLNKV